MSNRAGMTSSITMVPISFGEIASWAGLTGRRLVPWEVDLLRALDAVWLADPKGKDDGDRRHGPA